jgi:hypothetical protein
MLVEPEPDGLRACIDPRDDDRVAIVELHMERSERREELTGGGVRDVAWSAPYSRAPAPMLVHDRVEDVFGK